MASSSSSPLFGGGAGGKGITTSRPPLILPVNHVGLTANSNADSNANAISNANSNNESVGAAIGSSSSSSSSPSSPLSLSSSSCIVKIQPPAAKRRRGESDQQQNHHQQQQQEQEQQNHHHHQQQQQQQQSQQPQDSDVKESCSSYSCENPESSDTSLPLLCSSLSWSEALQRLETHPHEAYNMLERTKTHPLALACRYNAPPEIIRALARAAPELVRYNIPSRGTPLHEAVANIRVDNEIILFLLQIDERLDELIEGEQQHHDDDDQCEDGIGGIEKDARKKEKKTIDKSTSSGIDENGEDEQSSVGGKKLRKTVTRQGMDETTSTLNIKKHDRRCKTHLDENDQNYITHHDEMLNHEQQQNPRRLFPLPLSITENHHQQQLLQKSKLLHPKPQYNQYYSKKRATLTQDVDGNTPLHLLIRRMFQHIDFTSSFADVGNDTIESFATTATEAEKCTSLQLIQAMIQSCPEAVSVPDFREYSETPLVVVLKASIFTIRDYNDMRDDDDVGGGLLLAIGANCHRNEEEKEDEEGKMKLQTVSNKILQLEQQFYTIAQLMVQYNPHAVNLVLNGSRGEYTALHSAVFHGRCSDTVRLLLLAIHTTTTSFSSSEDRDDVYKSEDVTSEDKRRQRRQERHPALIPNQQGELPLHFACMRNENPRTIELLSSYSGGGPELDHDAISVATAVLCRDDIGLTPMHWLWVRFVGTMIEHFMNRLNNQNYDSGTTTVSSVVGDDAVIDDDSDVIMSNNGDDADDAKDTAGKRASIGSVAKVHVTGGMDVADERDGQQAIEDGAPNQFNRIVMDERHDDVEEDECDQIRRYVAEVSVDEKGRRSRQKINDAGGNDFSDNYDGGKQRRGRRLETIGESGCGRGGGDYDSFCCADHLRALELNNIYRQETIDQANGLKKGESVIDTAAAAENAMFSPSSHVDRENNGNEKKVRMPTSRLEVSDAGNIRFDKEYFLRSRAMDFPVNYIGMRHIPSDYVELEMSCGDRAVVVLKRLRNRWLQKKRYFRCKKQQSCEGVVDITKQHGVVSPVGQDGLSLDEKQHRGIANGDDDDFDRSNIRLNGMNGRHFDVSSMRECTRASSTIVDKGAPEVTFIDREEAVIALFWTKAVSLLRGAALASDEGDIFYDTANSSPTTSLLPNRSNFLIVHTACVSPSCPPSVARLAWTLFPDQLQIRDKRGRLPLHQAVRRPWNPSEMFFSGKPDEDASSPPSSSILRQEDDLYGGLFHGADDNITPSFLLQGESLTLIRDVMSCSTPEAARTHDSDRRLPLHYAVETFCRAACIYYTEEKEDAFVSMEKGQLFRGENTYDELLVHGNPDETMLASSTMPILDALRDLVGMYPESLERRDGVSGLYPFMQAATVSHRPDGEEAVLSIVYSLLRENPSLVSVCLRDK